MGRKPCCSKEGLKKGSWTKKEDLLLTEYIKEHGEGTGWRSLPKKAGNHIYFKNIYISIENSFSTF